MKARKAGLTSGLSCVILGKFLDLSVLQLPHVWNSKDAQISPL